MKIQRWLALGFLVASTSTTASAQCLEWDQRFIPIGTNAPVNASVIYNDGSGAALYIGGEFHSAGASSSESIAKWNGTSWSSLGPGVGGFIRELGTYDDGSGAALFASGVFNKVGSVLHNCVASWDGATWTALPGFVTTAGGALAAFDDGSGSALYYGGSISGMGSHLRWNGTSWSTTVSPPNSSASAFLVHDDGSGAALYAGGGFTMAGGMSARSIAKWNGTSWSSVGAGGEFDGNVRALAQYDDGSGLALYAGGTFTTAPGVNASCIAKWNGTSWSALDIGVSGGDVRSLCAADDGDGLVLYVGGTFSSAGGVSASGIASWNGSSWSAVDGGMTYPMSQPDVLTMSVIDVGDGPRLFAAGAFTHADDRLAFHVAELVESNWLPLGTGDGLRANPTLDVGRTGIATFDDGSGQALYYGGKFQYAGGETVDHVAKWNGSAWSALGGGLTGAGSATNANSLVVFDDGTGSALFVGGEFTDAGGTLVNNIAKWNGVSWSALDDGSSLGTNGEVEALAVFDDGSGTALYAAGEFTTAGGASVEHIARWNGSAWTPVGSGTSADIDALRVYDGDGGPALYAAGGIPAGAAAQSLIRWNGSTWDVIGAATEGLEARCSIEALTVFDDGAGPALFIGGHFAKVGGVPAKQIAKWSPSTGFSEVGDGVSGGTYGTVYSLVAFDDGSGTNLYAGGVFTTASGVAANNIARWDGSAWSTLGLGLQESHTMSTCNVTALAVFDDGADGAADLYVGGNFSLAGGHPSFGIAQWHGCAPGEAYCFGDGLDPLVTAECPCANFGNPGRGCANSNGLLGGARLSATGTKVPNTILMTCDGIPNNNLCTFFRNFSSVASSVYGDGIRCLGGTGIRFGQQMSGQNGNASNSVSSGVATLSPGTTRYYHVQYRNPSPGFCPPATFNASNAYSIAW